MSDIENIKPSGGFPPIFVCEKKINKKDDDENLKTRGFSQDENKIVASLKEIMEERKKEVKPFIIL
jgi:hypothetical protein